MLAGRSPETNAVRASTSACEWHARASQQGAQAFLTWGHVEQGLTASVVARKLVHLDLKSANILLQDKNFCVAKIADLGLSKYLGECSMLDHTMRVRAPHMPPDV